MRLSLYVSTNASIGYDRYPSVLVFPFSLPDCCNCPSHAAEGLQTLLFTSHITTRIIHVQTNCGLQHQVPLIVMLSQEFDKLVNEPSVHCLWSV